MKGTESIKVNFEFEGFEFELFAQPKPVRNQNAYRHMIVEHMLLMQRSPYKGRSYSLKGTRFKNRTCFCSSIKY